MLGLNARLLALLPLLSLVSARPNLSSRSNNSSGSSAPDGTYDVIILGGGIAGISAAQTLINSFNLTNILLVEARDELGGRAHTVNLTTADGSSVVVEKGCNWIQGPGKEVIQALADKWGLETTPTDYEDVTFFDSQWGEETDPYSAAAQTNKGQFLDDEQITEFTEGYDNFLDNAAGYSDYRTNNSLVDLSIRVATSIMDWIPVTPMQILYEYWNVDFTFAQPPEAASFSNAFGQEVGIADSEDRFVIDQRGYKYIFVQEARELFGQDLSDSRLKLGTTVQTVDYSANDTVKVSTDKGDFFAKHVISTLSVGVLQHQDVSWVPKLPDWKKEAIFSFDMALYQKIFMVFPYQFWGSEQFILRGDQDVRGRMGVWQNINAPGYFAQNTSANILMVTAVDILAREYEKLSDEDVQAQAMVTLREMYGTDIPDPDDIIVPRWGLDPLYRGSYSNWPLGVLDEHHWNLRQPVGNDRVWFTGEAMSEEAFGYVQGAWDEGQSTAQTVGSCLTGGECAGAEIYPALTTCAQQSTVEQPLQKRKGSRMAKRNGSPAARTRR